MECIWGYSKSYGTKLGQPWTIVKDPCIQCTIKLYLKQTCSMLKSFILISFLEADSSWSFLLTGELHLCRVMWCEKTGERKNSGGSALQGFWIGGTAILERPDQKEIFQQLSTIWYGVLCQIDTVNLWIIALFGTPQKDYIWHNISLVTILDTGKNKKMLERKYKIRRSL